ncbi:MAG: hypothetical protein GY930_08445 [bacterium]|nr:hypothetical protein [bacterium]
MQIRTEVPEADPGGALVLRASPIGQTLFALATGALLMAFAYFGGRWWLNRQPMLILLLTLPLGFMGMIVLAVFLSAIHSLRASFRPSNWSIQIGAQTLVINLRDFRNGEPNTPIPVLRLPIGEIDGMYEVTESWIRQDNKRGASEIKRRYIDLVVSDQDTAELARILAAEARKIDPAKRSKRTSFHFNERRVMVLETGIVRLTSTKPLRAALAEILKFGPHREVDLNESLEGLPSLMRAQALDTRGEHSQAARLLAKAEDFTLEEARTLLDQVAAKD